MALLEKFEQDGVWLFKYRSTLPIIILVIGLIVYLFTEINPGPVTLEGTIYEHYYEILCLAFSLLGLFIRVYTVGHTPSNTSGRNTEEQVADSLNTTGIYSIVRHPLYLGNFFMWLGPALLTGHLWFVISFCLFYWLYYERIMFAEEQFLRRKFGTMYTDWAENRPAFIPDFKNFVKPNLPFSWKKVMKQEKNGLLAVFLVFLGFDIVGNLIRHSTDFNDFLIAGTILTLLLYVVFKYLDKWTRVFSEEGR
ncbi:methyltransferase family protein [Flavihumibacter profundi]|uniref:methyltransferase family protein n=1 Tax=Flavihumibacter profundi TaxID=2716883 RepID=UPI001CC72A5E|nr:isoprenylcysteine carboxylmethyltransferase family protein [Flavihumibacter profundi]MBZ5858343.1 isoprenylcysteine carboxylmethyltransferase family protein [Flavihumibacter profundi]